MDWGDPFTYLVIVPTLCLTFLGFLWGVKAIFF